MLFFVLFFFHFPTLLSSSLALEGILWPSRATCRSLSFFFFLPRGDALYTTNSDSFCFIVFQLCEFEQTQSINKCNELCAWLLLPVSAARPRGRKKKKMPASRCILQSEEINRPPFFVFRTAYLGLFENCWTNAIDFGKKAETACACFDRITDLSRCSFLSYLQK